MKCWVKIECKRADGTVTQHVVWEDPASMTVPESRPGLPTFVISKITKTEAQRIQCVEEKDSV